MFQISSLAVKTFILLVAVFTSACLIAQAPTPPGGYTGSSLRSWFKSTYYTGLHIQHGYQNARIQMYNYIDNHGNQVTCVYSGYQKSVTYGGSGSNPYPINCEHTVPQSYFGYNQPMKSDLHHLFPTYGNWNSVRSNHPFEEIADNLTSKWMYLDNEQSSIPSSNIDRYSEFDYPRFEPREDHKGNVARAIFYFYTMYPTQAGSINSVCNLSELYQWHLNDPVDAREYKRNVDIAAYQGSRNPYIDYPGYAGIAWGLDSVIRSSADSCAMADLIISEYIEGSGSNRAIEVANFTGYEADLSDYSIGKQTNGSGSWSLISLDGELQSGEVYSVAYSGSSTALKNAADSTISSSVMNFDGNDVIGLFRFGTLIDIVGVEDQTLNFAQNVTLIRKDSVKQGTNNNYSASDWHSFAQDMIDSLGAHLYNCDVTVVIDTTPPDTMVEEPEPPIGYCTPDTQLVWPASDLFFSEYINGTSAFDCALEITNYTGSTVSLSSYRVRQQSNGTGGWTGGVYLSGTLADSASYVISFSYAADADIIAESDQSTSNTTLYYTGNDVIGLFDGATLIDIIGFYDADTLFGADTTYVRKCNMNVPSTSFCIAEWQGYAADETDFLGWHEHGPPCSEESEKKDDSRWTQARIGELQIIPNPADNEFRLVLPEASFGNADVQLIIYDVMGRPIYTQTSTTGAPISINVETWPAGIYTVQASAGKAQAISRVVVE